MRGRIVGMCGIVMCCLMVVAGCGGNEPLAVAPTFEEYCVPVEDPQGDECDDTVDTDPDPGGDGIWIQGLDWDTCADTTSVDDDQDGLDDFCESTLAWTFAPELVMAPACNWDQNLDRMGGEYFYAAQIVEIGGDIVDVARIAYLPAFYVDCGPPGGAGLSCSFTYELVGQNCEGHTGDSEMILVDLFYDSYSHHWKVLRVFLSAHCHDGQFGTAGCHWYWPSELEWQDNQFRDVPRVWVSQGKQALYPTRSDCNSGGQFNVDTCESNFHTRLFPIHSMAQNIGSRLHPFRDLTPAISGSSEVYQDAREYLWSTPPNYRFNGWQGDIRNDGSTPYGIHLADYAGF